MIFRKYLLPLLALGGFGFAVYTVRTENQAVIPAPPVAEPARSSFGSSIAGAGIIEASTQNIAVGTHVAGVAMRISVKVGDRVKAGDPLFTIDDREAAAELASREAALAAAASEVDRLASLPRVEEIPPAEASVREAEALLQDARTQFEMVAAVTDSRAVSREEIERRRWAVTAGEARLLRSQTDLQLLKAGAWKPELDIARARVASEQARVNQAKVEVERRTVRAPVDGEILQVNLRAGEYAQPGALETPLMLMGGTDVLHVRVDIDENDAWRFKPGAPAKAHLRGNARFSTPLRFVKVEPYVVPKRSLTGDSAERVDTRVLQAVYAFDRGAMPAYVGQQVDVFIEAEARDDAAPAPVQDAGSKEG